MCGESDDKGYIIYHNGNPSYSRCIFTADDKFSFADTEKIDEYTYCDNIYMTGWNLGDTYMSVMLDISHDSKGRPSIPERIRITTNPDRSDS